MDDDTQVRAVEGELTDELPPNARVLPGGKEEAARARQAEEKEAKQREKYELIRRRLRAKREEEAQEGEPPPEHGRTTVIERYAMTCMGNADRLAHHYGDRLRYVAPRKQWLWHDSVRWRWDDTARITHYARETVKKILDEAKMARSVAEALLLAAWCEKSQGASAINGMIKLAQPLLAAAPAALAAQREHLMTASGVIDLRTGALLEPDTANFDVHWTPVPYDPQAACPHWEAFLDQVMGGDQEMVAFLQRVAGWP